MALMNRLWVKFTSKKIGCDSFGNEYYLSKSKNYLGINKRLVIYKTKEYDGSTIPPLWHSWLHYLTNELPSNEEIDKHKWQKDFEPNKTGTKNAYDPQTKEENIRTYEAWKP